MNARVLLVDDDAHLLSGLERHLRRTFDLTLATGGAEALQNLDSARPFAAVVADMRMPGMTGVDLLATIKERAPDTVRIMLTGNADQQTAVDAINTGSIFRFFNKPCAADVLAAGLKDAVRQHELQTAEKELLDKTLTGSIKMLVDLLSMADPEGFGRANRIREWATRIGKELGVAPVWQLTMAAMLSPIGNIILPTFLAQKRMSNAELTANERKQIERVPGTAQALLANIPRLHRVAEIIYLQERGYDGSGIPTEGPKGEDLPIEARILKVLVDLDRLTRGAEPDAYAIELLVRKGSAYDPKVLESVRGILGFSEEIEDDRHVVELPMSLLRPGFILLEDLRLDDGRLLLKAGTKLSELHVRRLDNFTREQRIMPRIRVRKDQ